MKWAIVESKHDNFTRKYIVKYLETLEDCKNHNPYAYRAVKEHGEKILPIIDTGSFVWSPYSEELDRIVGLFDEKPIIGLEDRFPKNAPDFHCGWASPEGDTYSCEMFEHVSLERALAEKFAKELKEANTYKIDWWLLEHGWAKVNSKGEYLIFLKRTTDTLIRKLQSLGIVEM